MRSWAALVVALAAAVSMAQENVVPPPAPSADAVVIPAGSPLRERPDTHSPCLTLIDEDTPLVPLERRGGWILVRWRSWRAWVLIGEEQADRDVGRAPGPSPAPTPAMTLLRLQRNDRRAVLRARMQQSLRSPARVLPFGVYLAGPAGSPMPTAAFTLYTDSTDAGLIRKLAAAAGPVARFYEEHLVVVADDPRDVFLLSTSRNVTDTKLLKERRSLGIVVLPAGAPVERLVPRLVHEMAHVLNRPMGIELPAWLDEGLAESLSSSTFDPDGALRIGSLDPAARRSADRLVADVSGGRSLSLSTVARGASGCVAGGETGMPSAGAAMLARYLATAAPGAPLKGLLAEAVSTGRAVKDADILRALGRGEAALERDFRAWLSGLSAR